jgi:hypothetical protein
MSMPTYDILGITSHGLFWTVVETNVALTACCLPAMRPFLSLAAISSFLQALSLRVSSQKTLQNIANSSGKFSKMDAVTIGSARLSRNTSDISLVAIGNKEREAAPEIRGTSDSYEAEREERKYLGRSSVIGDLV